MAALYDKVEALIFSGDGLIIGATAVINAEINVNTLLVDQRMRGDISATGKIEIHPADTLYGDISTQTLAIEKSGLLDESCKMDRGVEAAAEKVTPTEEIRFNNAIPVPPMDIMDFYEN
jgi:cytoskeletal protein CcmA (bactofilin family)